MQIKKRLINKWKRLKDQGDVKNIAELLGMNEATVSRIMGGKQGTSSDTLLFISEYFTKREAKVTKIENDFN